MKITNTLNITNGDCAVEIMRKAGIPGVLLPWRDLLHEGPVPEGLALEKLSELRADYISSRGWGEPEEIRKSFIERDNMLRSFREFKKIVLWFEHDLYDQLQLLQLLDWLKAHPSPGLEVSMICIDSYLGMLSPSQMAELFVYETPIKQQHYDLAATAWAAFRSHTPQPWQALLNTDTRALPFLHDAIARMIEEYPSCTNGLSRTARSALEILSQSDSKPRTLFEQYQQTEQKRFLGDASFWNLLQELMQSSPPLLQLSDGDTLVLPPDPEQVFRITPTGRDVLDGTRHLLDGTNIDRWIGGVHLTADNIWCRDDTTGGLTKQ